MRAIRRSCVPALPGAQPDDGRYLARLDALALPPRRPWGHWGQVWTGLVSAALGLTIGVLATTLSATAVPATPVLTPQEQVLYHLVQELAQAGTSDQQWRIMTRLDKVVRTLHPQPRPGREVLLP